MLALRLRLLFMLCCDAEPRCNIPVGPTLESLRFSLAFPKPLHPPRYLQSRHSVLTATILNCPPPLSTPTIRADGLVYEPRRAVSSFLTNNRLPYSAFWLSSNFTSSPLALKPHLNLP